MWSAIARIFTKNEADSAQSGEESGGGGIQSMDRGEMRRTDLEMQDNYDTSQARQRAAVKWLLSKAFNNKVPRNLCEPFYRDHEQEHLKPPIITTLASAEMYCMALANIYSDPNYNNLSHWSILQTLARKGVCVTEPSNSALTETTLIQTNPLRLNAHMAVIESIMTLYAREVVTPDRVLAAIERFKHEKSAPPLSLPDSHEQGLLMWISHTCEALRTKIEEELQQAGVSNGGEGDRLRAPNFPPVKELKDLCDGVAIAALIAYYCPDELHWTDIKVARLPTVSESLHNLGLVQDFCSRCLPSSIFHMMPADITYLRGSMKQNLVVFLADLFNVVEIHPVKCVRYPGMDKTATVIRSTPTHTPLRKANSFQQSVVSDMSEDSLRRGSEDSFVVHRGKNIPTLSSIIGEEQQQQYQHQRNLSKERQNNDTKADERGESKAAGKPSNWEEHKRPSYAGRRSRRNSVTEDSQLTIENFGGSQDNLNFIGRNPDKDVAVHVGRKISAPSAPIENPAVRSTAQDARGSFQLGYDNGCEKSDIERENYKLKKQLSSDDISLRNLKSDFFDNRNNRLSFADVSNHVDAETKGIQLTYAQQQQQDKEEMPAKSSFKSSNPHTNGEKKTTSFATLPNTTTWQQQSTHNQQSGENNGDESPGGGSQVMASQLSDIRMKLEEKRRHIETEKRKMEVAMNKQRQKVGNAAFLQAVVKGKGNVLKSPNDAMTDSLVTGDSEPTTPAPDSATSKPQRPFTLQEISDDASTVERKWLDQDQPYVETRRTPDIENMDMEQYHHSMANLQDIQADIQRLANQQKQIQATQEQQLAAQQKQMYQQTGYMTMAQHSPYVSQQSYNAPQYQQGPIFTPLQSSASAPHIPQSLYQSHPVMNQPQFFLHQQQQQQPPPMHVQQPPMVPQRRTWAQHAQPPPIPADSYQQPDMRTWGKPHSAGAGFVLHDTTDRFQDRFQETSPRYQNGGDHALNHSNSHPGFTLSQQHQQQQQLYTGSHSTPSASPQHRNVHRQISQLMDDSKRTVSLQQIEPVRKSSVTHAPIPAPPVDDMAPQSISFIGKPDDDISEGLSRLNITSGSRTYRIPSPTRPLLSRNAFQPSPPLEKEQSPVAEVSSLDNDPTSQKGFYISFDNEQPKRPKPQLRTKKMSPKKERSLVVDDEPNYEQIQEALEKEQRAKQMERELEQQDRLRREVDDRRRVEFDRREKSQERETQSGATIIIGNELSDPDPEVLSEKERKKERIMMISMMRRQQQEEAKQRKEQEAQARKEKEKAKEEEKARKKEEQAQRRAAIFEQYKLKKAIEEAEREGKDVDKSLLNSLKPAPRMRPKAATRPRPKTIHIDSGSVEMAEGLLQPSRGKKGSNTNLTVPSYSTSTMKRDYYRGSQDSLAGSGLLYSKDSPDDSRGMSPCHSANQTLGRRSSYKTSRDPSPAQTRGRPKYSTYQNFKGRKSNSMMNLYGSSTDQDSLAYRYGDTDSGLGRATPPRRAPSPGMGPMRHLPSPSGPGSLPGLMSKRRIFDDGSSDLSSTPSSMMDYTGPRLYKQPTTKSNRGIMLNAVEYCVFPGVVNKDAKQKVLEEIARSESKHFLILFRDTGCQFRALYSYCPDREEVIKLYGTGPKQVNDRMFDKFFKYNSGGKCFSQVHTKHLTVTIDAFTIHNSLWQGKKVNLPNKKDMTLVI